MNDFMNLTKVSDFTRKRDSSWDRSGRNGDAWFIGPNETKTLADLKGPGIIRHIWFTIASPDPFYLRRILLRITWDDEEEPSVLCPVGDFFGLGHSRSYTYSCAAFSCSANDPKRQGEGVAMNCWLPMPFGKSARIEVVNEQADDMPINAFYFYIDWEKHESLPEDTLYFHAMWRRENPAVVKKDGSKECAAMLTEQVNLTDRYNYLILNAEGRGNFIGMNMSVDNLIGGWWGEGDDMFFIDREDGTDDCGGSWPPDLHGTGSEDYLCHAWGMQHTHSLYHGEPWSEAPDEPVWEHHSSGKVAVYRYHIVDPVPFTKKLRVSIEHGHANDRENDIASVAYWYQDEPHKKFPAMLPPEERLPRIK